MNIDLSPLYRHTVGYDRIASLLDAALRVDPSNPGYPPYNIEVVDNDRYAITLAVAGFGKDELELEVERGVLSVRGKKREGEGKRKYLHQGIAFRSFERKFNLAEHVEVAGAEFQDGLLAISLVRRIPEAMKAKRIEIASKPQALEHNEVQQESSNDEAA